MDRDWLGQMIAGIEADPDVGVVAPKILMFDKPHLINEAGNTLSYAGLYGACGLQKASLFRWDDTARYTVEKYRQKITKVKR